jgi:hypothetical protein
MSIAMDTGYADKELNRLAVKVSNVPIGQLFLLVIEVSDAGDS